MYLEGLQIHCISDTHNKHKHFSLPGGDILIHSGDATSTGELHQIINFLDWFAKQNYKHKIFVPGNHDWGFEHNPELFKEECKNRGIHLLMDSGVELEGIKFWGSPVQPWFYDWAFNRHRGADIKKHWDLIPMDIEVLITHGPAHKILDWVPRGENVGCQDLFNAIMDRPSIKMHVCGHIHPQRGYKRFMHCLFVNAAALRDRYQPVRGVPIKVVKDIVGQYFPECEAIVEEGLDELADEDHDKDKV